MRSVRRAAALVSSLVLACGGAQGGDETTAPPPPPAVAAVAVGAPAPNVTVGAAMQLGATVTDAAGHTLSRPVAWSTSDADVASVSSSGLVTGVAPGEVTITATAEGKAGSVRLAVTPRPIAEVVVGVVAPAVIYTHVAITVGSSVPFGVVARDSTGRVVTDAPAARWTSTNAAIASVDQHGVVRGQSPGVVQIRATITTPAGDRTGAADVMVTTLDGA